LKKKIKKLSFEELEQLASTAMEALIDKLEEEEIDLVSGVLSLEMGRDGDIKARIEVEVRSSTPLFPNPEEKAAELIDAVRRKIENGIFEETEGTGSG